MLLFQIINIYIYFIDLIHHMKFIQQPYSNHQLTSKKRAPVFYNKLKYCGILFLIIHLMIKNFRENLYLH